ncbi:CHY zinc finger protein [Endozoicomonas sp. SESOKO4]|uniref:CHY zinc finger protein n=1 Tax=Endozoicomonas sp. SESOKO4 TaxID=2828745 RepID=UPI0021481B8C|nr:CHY zinc finger protein [Endozoicomonas sp. SESOKO4]
MHFYRLFTAFVVSLLATAIVPLCYPSTFIERHSPDGQMVQVEINDGTDPRGVSQWQVSLLLPEGFNDQNNILCFKAPLVSADSNSIAILVTNNLSDYCYQLVIVNRTQPPAFQKSSKNGTLARLKSMTADRPELASLTTHQLLNSKIHTTPLTLLAYSDKMTGNRLETRQTRNNTLTLTGDKLATNADFPGSGNGGFFYSSHPPPRGGRGGGLSGLFEIDLIVLKPVVSWLMSIGKDSTSFEEQLSPARLKMTRVNADGSSGEAVIPVGWLDFLNIEQLTDADFWNTLFQRAATSCPASENLQWQLGCLKLFLERTALKTHHGGRLKTGIGDGEPSGRVPDKEPKDENNDHQKEQRDKPEDQESRSPGEHNDGTGDGNNRKDDNGDNGEESEKNASTQDLLELANQLIATIESGSSRAVFKLRQILDELDMPQRLQVLETVGTNSRGNPVTPIEAVLQLQRSFKENSSRNRFIEQLIEATSDKTRTLNDLDMLSLQPMPPDRVLPQADNNLRILYKILLDIIHGANQYDQQPPIGQFEKCCFTEFFAHLFLIYSNPLELIRNLLGEISDLATRHDVMINEQSLTFPTCFLDTFIQFHQHPSFHELKHFVNKLLTQVPAPDHSLLVDQPYSQPSLSVQTRQIHGLPSDASVITPGSSCNAGSSPDNHEPQHLNHDLGKLERAVNGHLSHETVNALKRIAQQKEEKKRQQLQKIERQMIERRRTGRAVNEHLSLEKVYALKKISEKKREKRRQLIQQIERQQIERQQTEKQQIEELTTKFQGLRSENHDLRSRVNCLQADNERLEERLQIAKDEHSQQSVIDMPHPAPRQMAAASLAMRSNHAEDSAPCQQSSTCDEQASGSNEHLQGPSRQESKAPFCNHYQRFCSVGFACCEGYFPCHKCHNENKQSLCKAELKAWNAIRLKCSLCGYEGDITENSQTCPACQKQMSQYYCAKCKHFASTANNPFHCDKCGICRIYADKAFHCDGCGACLTINLKGNHKCLENAGSDECFICLEDTFCGCRILLCCSHVIHEECAVVMLQHEIRTCLVCKRPLYSQIVENHE